MKIRTEAKCPECCRVFDFMDADDASEWFYGHDCEVITLPVVADLPRIMDERDER